MKRFWENVALKSLLNRNSISPNFQGTPMFSIDTYLIFGKFDSGTHGERYKVSIFPNLNSRPWLGKLCRDLLPWGNFSQTLPYQTNSQATEVKSVITHLPLM